jgi:hypothetical protein
MVLSFLRLHIYLKTHLVAFLPESHKTFALRELCTLLLHRGFDGGWSMTAASTEDDRGGGILWGQII